MLDLQNPVIAGIRKDCDFAKAVESPVSAIFLLKADVMTLRNLLKEKKDIAEEKRREVDEKNRELLELQNKTRDLK